jgi:hypothetical protein
MKLRSCLPLEEQSRCRLIGDLVTLLREDDLPSETREAALTLVAWLARRMPWDTPSNDAARQKKDLL